MLALRRAWGGRASSVTAHLSRWDEEGGEDAGEGPLEPAPPQLVLAALGRAMAQPLPHSGGGDAGGERGSEDAAGEDARDAGATHKVGLGFDGGDGDPVDTGDGWSGGGDL